MSVTAYPLQWPQGWKRTPAYSRPRAQFGKVKRVQASPGIYRDRKESMSVAEARDRLSGELDRLGARYVTLSSNLELNLNGTPRSNQREPDDHGAAIYFRLGGKDMALACDRWDRVADNIAAIAKHIEALRGMDRWGVGSVAQAFAGYEALPAPDGVVTLTCWEILNLEAGSSEMEIERAYRLKAKSAHPDRGGSREEWDQLRNAYDQAKRAVAA